VKPWRALAVVAAVGAVGTGVFGLVMWAIGSPLEAGTIFPLMMGLATVAFLASGMDRRR
jgi:hypothetical protein